MAGTWDVDLGGLRATQLALKQYAPDLRRNLYRDISVAMKPIIRDARGFVPDQPPLRGWGIEGKQSRSSRQRPFPHYDAVEIRKGFKMMRAGTRRSGRDGWRVEAGIRNTNAAGVIYEVAGTKNPDGDPRSQSPNKNAGRQFIRAIAAQSGMNIPLHKLGVRAVVANRKEVNKQIDQAVAKANDAFLARDRKGSR